MTEPDKNLEQFIHQRLRALPQVRAPKELVPSVLRRISARPALAWWKRPWLEWPLMARVVSAVLFAGGLGGGCWEQENICAFLRESNTGGVRLLTAAGSVADGLAGAMQHLIHYFKNPWFLIAVAVAATLYLTVAAVLGLFCRIAVEPSPNNR